MLTTTRFIDSGDAGFHTHRIPSLLLAADGTLLAFWEGRRHGKGDSGEVDLVMRRSGDGGETWSELQPLVAWDGFTCGNPCPVLDRRTGRIVMMLTVAPHDALQKDTEAGTAPRRTVGVMTSDDHGRSWSEPREISSQVMRDEWAWFAAGPGHGQQLAGGRLVIPCDHVIVAGVEADVRARSHLALSDDGGETWRIGGIVPVVSNESCAMELSDGTVYINCRTRIRGHYRAWGRSRDGGESFAEYGHHTELLEPWGCQASLLRVDDNLVLYSGLDIQTPERQNLTIRWSRDDCRTWSAGRTLCAGPSGYSDMALLPDGTIACLYEAGESLYNERLDFARFNLDWVLEGEAKA